MSTVNSLIFHHVPKAGGTSLLGALSNNFSINDTYSEVRRTKWENFNYFVQSTRNRKKPYKLVLGHMPLGVHEHLDGPFTYISIVRDPVKRVVSLLEDICRRERHYLHKKFHEHYSRGGIDAVLDTSFSPEVSNEITRYFNFEKDSELIIDSERYLESATENINNLFGPIGVTEEFDAFLILLKRELGLKWVYYFRKNQTQEPLLNFTKEQLAKIAELNQYDMRLYKFLKGRFQKQFSEYEFLNEELADFQRRNSAFGKWISYALKIRNRFVN